ncbi:MAG: nucleotide sugar dehydrogenase, partial [Candidatus Omnitrophica bacterium]|nr:nucleotide sugar dehydrogenase [Candidatus Omnitrophota bacterium]
NAKYRTNNIPKVIGGLTIKCLDIAKTLYSEIVSEVVTVSSPRAAEMVKLLENSFRSVNIALANEVALICSKMGIDVWEVIKAAESKPFGFMPFYPGPGIGGHCIPADPMYLIWKSRLSGYEPKLIRTAHEINSAMPGYVVSRVVCELKSKSIPLSSSSVLIVGVAYKPDVNDIRESPALEIIHILSRKGARVEFYDPHVKELQIKGRKYKAIDLSRNNIAKYDAVAIITNHSSVDYGIFKKARLVLDTRNALKWNAQNIVKI